MFKKLLFLTLLITGLIMADSALAQTISLNIDDTSTGSATARIFSVLAIITVLSLAPSIIIMMTSFTRLIVVFSITRSALATNATPPNMVLISLAFFMTIFIMSPTFEKCWDEGIKPVIDEKIDLTEGLEKAALPLKEFMINNTRDKDLQLFSDLSGEPSSASAIDTPLKITIPSFMISELRRAFEIGFLIYLPFLIIDMVVASVLMSMGMMMLPPSVISLPFKVIFFVLIDGWYMLAGSLINSFH
ncbi:MAG: flagellar type III secretion system pore protein FliP [Alphaproteobacteria bacterium]|nr:flagellar type III secretion system pore protein FliP [Alphaproteobacteria bacterium]MBQ9235691.1 flagellar type III secretion system pore protein FliP [Alphaproteobacteria bacterium]